jgi:hypothetical protein
LVCVGDDAPQTLQSVTHLREPVAQTTHLAQLHPQEVVGAGGVPAAGVVGAEGVDRQAIQFPGQVLQNIGVTIDDLFAQHSENLEAGFRSVVAGGEFSGDGVEGRQRHEPDGDQPISRQHEPYWRGRLGALGAPSSGRRAHIKSTTLASEAAG